MHKPLRKYTNKFLYRNFLILFHLNSSIDISFLSPTFYRRLCPMSSLAWSEASVTKPEVRKSATCGWWDRPEFKCSAQHRIEIIFLSACLLWFTLQGWYLRKKRTVITLFITVSDVTDGDIILVFTAIAEQKIGLREQ